MEPNRREFIKQCAFQKFCNTVLHNEACDAHKELHRHKAREITFSDLTLEEARQLHTFDEYFKGEIAFERAGKKITPKLLLEAIRTLPEEKRRMEQMPKGNIHERLAWGMKKSEMENQQRKKTKSKNREMER